MIDDDLNLLLTHAVFGLWQKFPRCHDNGHFSYEKRMILDKITQNSHLGLLNSLPLGYDRYLETLEKYLSGNILQTINFPRCEIFPRGFSYGYCNELLPANLFSEVEGAFMESLEITLELIVTQKSKMYYDYNHEISYHRKPTMESRKDGRFGKVCGKILLVVSDALSVEVTSAVMTIIMLAYMDHMSMLSHEGYDYVPPLSGRFSLSKNTDEFLKCSTDPCVNLIGTIINQTEYFPKPETLWPSVLRAVGQTPEEIIETVAGKIKADPMYSMMRIISENLDRVEAMSKEVDEAYLCDMWKRGMKIEVHSREEVLSFLRSSFDNIKNTMFAEIVDRMVHSNEKFFNMFYNEFRLFYE